MSTDSFQQAEGFIVVVLTVGAWLGFLAWRLQRRRRGLALTLPLAVGFGLRLLALGAIDASGLGSGLRGGDETTFLTFARLLATSPWGRGFWPHGPYQLQTVVFGAQIKLLDLSEAALRVTQVGIALTGVALIVVAVHDLAGERASRLAAWLLALEPASIFFASVLHKEPLMTLASGLVVLGATKIWQRLSPLGFVMVALGGLVAVETRSYAGWFLVAGAVFVLLHAGLRQLRRPGIALPIIGGFLIAAVLLAPTLLQLSSKSSLKKLQSSQSANATGAGEGLGANGSNLALETVDFSTRGAVLAHLPQRIRDLLLRPYPWQLQNTSQRLGAIGSLVAWAGFVLLLRYAWRARGRMMIAIAPILYPLLFLMVAYALSVGNAGTGFRYRTHLVTLAFAVLAALRAQSLRDPVEARTPLATPIEPTSREVLPALVGGFPRS